MSEAIREPNRNLLLLDGFDTITGIAVEYRSTGTETAASWVTLTGQYNNKPLVIEGWWLDFERFLILEVRTGSIARIKQTYRDELTAWKSLVKKEQRDLSEYKRLCKKFGPMNFNEKEGS